MIGHGGDITNSESNLLLTLLGNLKGSNVDLTPPHDSCIMPLSRRYKPYNHNSIRPIGELMLCEFCGGETKKKSVKRQHWLKKKLYIVEDLDAEVCTECGERYFHAKTLDAIDNYLSKKHTVKAHMDVEIVSFSQAVP